MRCPNCPLTECVVVAGCGADPADIVLVGEAPGNTEVKEGQPFVGPAGRLLDRLLEDAGLSGRRIYKTNSILCRPWPHRAPSPEEVKACNPRLWDEVLSKKPKVIVGLGNIALRALTGKNGITKNRGLAGEKDGIPIVCTYHPAAILRGREEWYHAVRQDLMMARDLLDGNRPNTEFKWWIVDDVDDLAGYTLYEELTAVDVETDSQGNLLCVGLGRISPEFGMVPRVHVVRWDGSDKVRNALSDILSQNQVLAHNAKFDVQVLWRHGIECNLDHDTMLMHYALENKVGRNGLKDMAATYLYVGDYDADIAPYIDRLEELPFEDIAYYNAQDVAYTLLLFDMLKNRIRKEVWAQKLYLHLLIPAARTLAQMEYRGTQIDLEALERLGIQYEQEMADLYRQMVDIAGEEFNPNSPKQIEQILYYKLNLPVMGKQKTDRATLLKLQKYTDNPFPDLLLRYRKTAKLHSTYVEGLKKGLDQGGRVHGNFNIHTTATGRLSSSGPNLQNIPTRGTKDIRNLFVASPGYTLIEADVSQAELRCLAWYSKDENLIEIIRSGKDMHTQTAALMFGVDEEEVTPLQRHIGKTLNFAVLYGAGPGKVVETIKDAFPDSPVTPDDAARAIRRWHGAFPRATQWIHEVQQYALENHRTITTPFGRSRRFDLITPENKDEVLRQAVNTPIQSLASDLTLAALVEIERWLLENYLWAYPLLTVHDSILFEVSEDLPVMEVVRGIRRTMLESFAKTVGDEIPFEVEVAVGERWGSLKEVELAHV